MFRSVTQLSISLAFALSGSAAAQPAATVSTLDPFRHVAVLPSDADLASIQFQGVKLVKVATKVRPATETSYCREQALRDPSGSLYCRVDRIVAKAPAYKVDYSYKAQPLASDESGSRNFTFSVYYRPQELSAEAREAIARGKGRHPDVARIFEVKTYKAPQQRIVIDEQASKFCQGNLVDGSWTKADAECQEELSYRTVTAQVGYVTVQAKPLPPSVAGR